MDDDELARAGLVDIGRAGPSYAHWPGSSRIALRHRARLVEAPAAAPVPENLINRALPPELLLSIFSLLTYDIADHGAAWHYSPLWIYVTHVCRSWRDLALASTLLWTRISFAHPDLASAMLARSGDAQLDIAYGDRLRRLPPLALYAALAQLPRTRSLRLNVTRALLAHLAPRLPGASLTLQRIHIDVLDGQRGHTAAGIAHLRAPALRALVLDGVPVRPDAPLLAGAPQLAELALSGLPRPARWRVAELLPVLRRAPRLTRLQLVQALEDEDEREGDADADAGGPVALPLLRQLTLHAPTPAVAALVARVTGAPRTRFQLTCTVRAPADAHLSRAVPPALRAGALRRLELDFGLTEFAVRAHTAPDGPAALALLLEPERALDGAHASGRASALELLASPALDFGGVERLAVAHDGALARGDMEAVYAALAARVPAPRDFGVHARDMEMDGGTVGQVFLKSARRIRVRVRSWQPTGLNYGRSGREWAVDCIRKWSFEQGAGAEKVVLDGEAYTGAKLAALMESTASHKNETEI